ncbi:MAG TPA: PRC-barrel domain-containing protein [Steroidobacteraceae bacterium]|nr:PRC-barrel domain-containing protein [Steroidobacteraceae bacterium]
MSKSSIASCIAIIGLFGGALAQAQQPAQQPTQPQPSTSETEGTAADRTQPGQTPTTQGQTPRPTQGAPTQAQDPRPSTSQTEGTAADRSPPGRTPTTQGPTRQGTQTAGQSELVGAAVVSTSDAPLGKVVDVVFDAQNQPAFVVISSGGTSTAVPYSVANSMMTADKIVIDQSRLKAAPKVKQGEWRSEANSSWKQDAARYWDRS